MTEIKEKIKKFNKETSLPDTQETTYNLENSIKFNRILGLMGILFSGLCFILNILGVINTATAIIFGLLLIIWSVLCKIRNLEIKQELKYRQLKHEIFIKLQIEEN